MKYSEYLSESGFVVFLFHGVIRRSSYRVRNYNRKHLEEDYFEGVIGDLVKRGNAISLDQFLDSRDGKSELPPFAFAVTFDDGFENNLSVAAPILEKYQVPATFYITSGFVDCNSMSWIDQIEFMIERYRPASVRMPWRQEPFPLLDAVSEISFLDAVRTEVKSNPDVSPMDVVDIVAEQVDGQLVLSSDDPLDRKLTWSEVAELGSKEGFTIGGHTHTHAILGYLSRKEAEIEIRNSLGFLKEKAGCSTVHFSYPEGFVGSYNSDTIALLKNEGVKCCPTAVSGSNRGDTDPFELRRINVV